MSDSFVVLPAPDAATYSAQDDMFDEPLEAPTRRVLLPILSVVIGLVLAIGMFRAGETKVDMQFRQC